MAHDVEIQADYVVIGAGAMGMAFADTLVAETQATVAIVDRHHAPGGHWTMAYPFVRLHQPSSGYGVNSRTLGADALDETGLNAGLHELASVGEVCAYFDAVMQKGLLPSGRVTYHPMTEWDGADGLRSRVTGGAARIAPGCRVVDATYQDVTVPAMRPPPYAVAPGVACGPPNALVELNGRFERFTIVGAGKTGIDAALWLLRQGVEPDRIRWIMPRDSWLIDRSIAQPFPAFAARATAVFTGQFLAIQAAQDIDEMFEGLEACGRFVRLDPGVKPTMYRCATVSMAELEQLRRIGDVVRLGRVEAIETEHTRLEQGEISTSPSTFHVDCSADGLARRPEVPVFSRERITLQSVRTCQQVFSAALIAHVEATRDDPAAKAALCRPIAHPDDDLDFLRTTIADAEAEARWAQDPELSAWLRGARLNWPHRLFPAPSAEPAVRAVELGARADGLLAIADKLRTLLANHDRPAATPARVQTQLTPA